MKKTLAALVLGLALVQPTASALASDYKQISAETEARVREVLTAQGYEVARIKMEDGYYEAYARKDGKKLEVYLDESMNIVRVKND